MLVIATGISSVVGQLLLLREFLSQFQGNEFTIALILFFWLVLGGIGTWLARLAGERISLLILIRLSMLLALFYPATLLAIRLVRGRIFIPGIDIGFYPTLGCIGLLSLCCALLVGFVLPCSLHLLRQLQPDYPGARLYMLDNIGDVSGGALFSFVLIFWTTPLQAAFLAGLLLLAGAIFALLEKGRYHPTDLLLGFLTLALLLCCLFLEKPSLTPFEGTLVHYRESRYGRITIVRQKEQFTMFLDGSPLYSSQNTHRAEMAIHYPLSQIQRPGSVLLIGAESGEMQELAKYNLGRIDYLELDPQVTATQFRYNFLQKIKGLNVLHMDGRRFLSETDQLYDAIILNLPEPDTFQVNRFYTAEFFALAHDHLRSGGIFSFSVEGYDNYLARPQQEKLSSLFRTAGTSFREILAIPGGSVHFLCSDKILDANIPALLAKQHIETRFVAHLYHGNVTPQRRSYLHKHLLPDVAVNHDSKPFLLQVMIRQWFSRFNSSPMIFIIVCGGLLSFYLLRSRSEELVLFSTGFVTMGSESLVILVYQIFFGYVYFHIGLLVTIFLLGLLPGALLGERLRQKEQNKRWLLTMDMLIILWLGCFGVPLLFEFVPAHSFVLFVFGFILSMLCGCQFPLALGLGGNDSPAAIRTFSADLIGAACGTLVTSLLLVPALGIVWTTGALMLVKLLGGLLLGMPILFQRYMVKS